MEEVIINNENNFEELKKKILEDGKDQLHVLSDFDRTLTKAFVDGKKIPSVVSILRQENHLGEEYSKAVHELFDKYHPIEINHEILNEEKEEAMKAWWENHFDLLIESGLNKKHINEAINSGKIQFREGVVDFLKLLHFENISLVIFSSAGLGGDSIKMFLEKENVMFSNIHIVSNSFIWDENSNAIGIKKPIIHVMNKDETILKNFEFFEKIENRKNVILLGDSLGDVGMLEGFNYKNLIKIGFLNLEIEKSLEKYKKNFDVVILNDGSFDFVNKFFEELQ